MNAKAMKVLQYVSRGRGYVDVEPYPDSAAREALGELRSNEADQRDAARYRWIRRRAYVAGNGWMFGGAYKPINEYAYTLKGRKAVEDCDAAIDAAMRQSAPSSDGYLGELTDGGRPSDTDQP